jgi:hypothetical protein
VPLIREIPSPAKATMKSSTPNVHCVVFRASHSVETVQITGVSEELAASFSIKIDKRGRYVSPKRQYLYSFRLGVGFRRIRIVVKTWNRDPNAAITNMQCSSICSDQLL